MYTLEHFKQALEFFEENEPSLSKTSYGELRFFREDIQTLRNQFKEKYGFELLDFEIAIIWKWKSEDYCASWIQVDKDSDWQMRYFDDFIEGYCIKEGAI